MNSCLGFTVVQLKPAFFTFFTSSLAKGNVREVSCSTKVHSPRIFNLSVRLGLLIDS